MPQSFLFTSLICVAIFTSLNSFTGETSNSIVQDVVSQTNQFRASKGLATLVTKEELNAIAQQHSQEMASGRVAFGHDGFQKRNARAVASIGGIRSFAENVAYGAATGKAVVTMWKNSAGHRRNMLGKYRYIGVGIAKDRQGRIFYTEVFAG